ncbi:MAG: TRAP transporter small permease subunit [Sedimentitalea sp.]
MERALRLADRLTWICDQAARLAAVVMVALVFVIIYDVIGRKFFATGSIMLQEVEWHMHGLVALFCIGFAYTRDAHVRIDVLADKINERLRLWLEFWVLLVFVTPFLLIIVWYGYEFTERAFLRGEGANGGRGLPHRWVIKSVVPLSAAIAICACIAVMIRLLAVLKRPDLRQSAFEKAPLWKF